MLSFAFESMMPTKVIAVGMGPGGSGKTTLFRSVGQILIGPSFQVDSPLQDQKGEEDFWVNLSHSFYCCYDNVDQQIRWLPDALAQVATGIRRSKRELDTSSRLHRRDISCMLSTTARTPRSLRRDDVSDRSLHFVLERLDAKRPEYEIQDEVVQMRDELMSDYARMVQLALRVPMDQVKVSDDGMRMADFARVATRIRQGLGPEMKEVTDEAIALVNTAQNRFATEESHLATLLEVWVDRFAPAVEGSMALGEFPNAGREVTPKELLVELRAIAREMDLKFRPGTPEALSRDIRNLREALSLKFEVTGPQHTKRGSVWRFALRTSDEAFA